jgi:two-component system, cell cycle sensor histidine kinase and response regulator CckA
VAQLDALLAQLPLGLAMTDRDGRFLFGNEAFLRSVGREGRGLPPFPTDLVCARTRPRCPMRCAATGAGLRPAAMWRCGWSIQPGRAGRSALRACAGWARRRCCFRLADSSQENQLRRQVAQATKMQAVGQLAGGVAHDFNNVLTAIIGTCDLMLLRHIPGDSDYDDIQQIRANSNRAAALTRQLLAFSRQQTLRPEIIQLPDVVSEVSPLIKRLLGEKITYYVQHDRNLGPGARRSAAAGTGDHEPRGQCPRRDPVARQRAGADFALHPHASGQAGDPAGFRSAAAADYTVLIVQDTGGGIPPHVLPKLFEPFFTTKEQGKGTGPWPFDRLRDRQAIGRVHLRRQYHRQDRPPDRRALHGLFPRPPRRGAQEAPVQELVSSDWSAGGKVLLVEDEDMVRIVAERALARAGYEVTTAPMARKAWPRSPRARRSSTSW